MLEKTIIHYEERELHPMSIQQYRQTDKYFEFTDNVHCTLRVYVLTDAIARVRYGVHHQFKRDFSYALDPKLEKENIHVEHKEDEQYHFLETSKLILRIEKENMKITFMDKEGFVLNDDEKGFHWEHNTTFGGNIVQMTKAAYPNEAFYGLGDKTVSLNMRGHRFQNWGTDNYGYNEGTDPLYKSIPFYYGLRKGIAYGIFYDNSYDSYFDFCSERSEVSSFWSMGGEMNYYFIAGPKLMDVAERYTMLTGTPEMPPFWSMGFQQCKWSYYPESKVREIAGLMRKHQIPCDAIYLDIDYMDGFRCFTWDYEKFPNPKGLVADLEADGFKTMVIIDPGIKLDYNYPVFKEGLEKGYFCKHADGVYVMGKVWPGDCYFPDFTNPDAREWWAGLYKELIEEIGIAGVWNDMNEPALFEVPTKTFPLNVMHDYEGQTTSHREMHNVYGMQMARATQEGVKRFSGGKRSLIITRSGYAGMQRFSSVWTGDNIASWEHIWMASMQAQRLSISGVSFCGSDIGGFIGQPNGEMMVRWIAMGIFHPFCRVHSSGDHGDQEPWVFGDTYTDIFRKFVELRYKLLPYLYSTFYKYHVQGTPMLRPLIFFDQDDNQNIDRDHEFLCGDHLLVCTVDKQGIETVEMYIPRGTWYDYYSGEKYTGGKVHNVACPLDQIPLFVKAGGVIPHYPIQQYTSEKTIDEVTLKVYHALEQVVSTYYEDDHTTYAYENGEYRLAKIQMESNESGLSLTQTLSGSYDSPIKTYRLLFVGFPEGMQTVNIDGEELSFASEMIVNSDFVELRISK